MHSLAEIVQAARARGPRRLAVAWGHDTHTLEAVSRAAAEGLVTPIIYGVREVIANTCADMAIDTSGWEIVDCASDTQAVAYAVTDVAEGRADVLMKGLVSTDKYMRGILHNTPSLLPDKGLLSHISVFEIPERGKLLLLSDVAVIPQPDFKQKVKLIGFLAKMARTLGIDTPRIACLAPSEQVLPQVTSSAEAAILAKMADRGQLGNVLVDGPLSLDVALYPEVAREKGVKGSSVAGEADCLLFPNIESGNVFFKAATHMGHAEVAALVAGTTAPCVLTSRGDTPQTKLYSIALACLCAH